jgi:hypothetical protein
MYLNFLYRNKEILELSKNWLGLGRFDDSQIRRFCVVSRCDTFLLGERWVIVPSDNHTASWAVVGLCISPANPTASVNWPSLNWSNHLEILGTVGLDFVRSGIIGLSFSGLGLLSGGLLGVRWVPVSSDHDPSSVHWWPVDRGLAIRPVNWLSVNWLSVNWLSVNWLSVNWLSVNWLSVNWLSVNWLSVWLKGLQLLSHLLINNFWKLRSNKSWQLSLDYFW